MERNRGRGHTVNLGFAREYHEIRVLTMHNQGAEPRNEGRRRIGSGRQRTTESQNHVQSAQPLRSRIEDIVGRGTAAELISAFPYRRDSQVSE